MTKSSEDSAGPNAEQPGEVDAPEVVGERLRRPASLRAAAESVASVPRRRLATPPFPKPDAAASPATESMAAAGDPVAVEDRGASQLGKLVALVNERPEVGLGIAFVGGLVLATILKRLAR